MYSEMYIYVWNQKSCMVMWHDCRVGCCFNKFESRGQRGKCQSPVRWVTTGWIFGVTRRTNPSIATHSTNDAFRFNWPNVLLQYLVLASVIQRMTLDHPLACRWEEWNLFDTWHLTGQGMSHVDKHFVMQDKNIDTEHCEYGNTLQRLHHM